MGKMSRIPKMILAVAIVWMLLMGQAIAASDSSGVSPQKEQNALVNQLNQLTGSKVRIGTHALTGKVRYIGVDPSNPIRQPAALSAKPTPEEAARGFLSKYGSLFGLSDQARELSVMRTKSADQGRSFVRFQQLHSGIPVLGGELIVQANASNNIISANGEILPNVSVDTTPAISADVAAEKARGLVFKYYGNKYKLATGSLQVSKPELWIYNPVILGVKHNFTRLVWRMEVYSTELLPINELVLVDAHLGNVALHFNQIDTARYRLVYDHANTVGKPLPGDPADLKRSEGGAASGIPDVDNAYIFAGNTYDFYSTYHGRDSLDNAGMSLISTTRYCPDAGNCPYANAFWNGEQMVYGATYSSALDVVGHEMTHGVTDYESRLFYYMQSGAINEAFSDIWGECIEQVNGRGETQWLMGQDLPIGAIRSMSNPPTYGDPDRMGSSYYYFGTDDRGGVHYNSGVANKAAYLMAVGGTFNGLTVTSIGITKTAKIFYEVQTNLFTSASDYNDLYDGLRQACANLVGTSGITVSNCQQVENAVNATEMNQQPTSCPAQEALVCDSGQIVTLFFDDLENTSSGKWTHAAIVGADQWYYPQNPNPYWDPTYATSGQYNFWGYDYYDISDSYIAMTQNVAIPAGAYLHFNHAYSFETTYDGGVIEYSTNSGSTWNDAGSLITYNDYTGTLSSSYSNPLGGRSAFTGNSRGYISTRLDLSSLAGQNVRFRFRIGTDNSGDDYGWWIDDIRIYTCSAAVCSQFGFNEDFNDNQWNNWTSDTLSRWSIGGDATMTGTGSNTRIGAVYLASYCDFIYQIRMRKTAGTLGDGMGIIFRANGSNLNTGSGYVFYIDAQGKFELVKVVSGADTVLIPWTSSSALNTGLAAWNTLKVVAFGSTISIYANGTLLGSVTDTTFLSGYAGIIAYDSNTGSYNVVDFDVATLDTKKEKGLIDFEDDWKTDIAAYHSATGLWFIRKSSDATSYSVGYGGTGYVPAPGDYDRDGKIDVAVYHAASGLWFIKKSSDGTSYFVGYGGTGYIPVPGDYDGDGKTDVAVYHQATGLWFCKPSSGLPDSSIGYGGTGYDPVFGDFDGDGKTDIAVYHSATGIWFIRKSSDGTFYSVGYGGTSYVPVPGDYDGDGKTDVAVYHQATGLWFIKPSSGAADYYVGYGGTGYVPVPGDYDGDGKTDIAAYHSTTGLWFIRRSSNGTSYSVGYGGTGYAPVNLDYLYGYVY